MAKYDPLKKYEEKEPDNNWFIKASIRATILGGLAFGAYKMKGPAGKLINKFQENRMKLILERDGIKEFDVNDVVNDGKSFKLQPIGEGKTTGAISPRIRSDLVTEESVRTKILNLENYIMTTGENSIAKNLPGYIKGHSKEWAQNVKAPTFTNTHWDNLFMEVKRDALLAYFSQEGGVDAETLKEFMSYEGKLNGPGHQIIVDKINKLHDQYVFSNNEYAHTYKTMLTQVSKNIEASANVLKPKTVEQFRKQMYQGVHTKDPAIQASIAIWNERYFESTPMRHPMTGDLVKHIDLLEDNRRGFLNDKMTYSSNSGFRKTNHKLFEQIQEIDYTGQFKKLADTLTDLQSNSTTNKVLGVDLKLEKYESQHYLKLKLTHADRPNAPIEVTIPISQDGRMPTSHPSGTSRIDQFFNIADDASTPKLINKSGMMIHQVIKSLKSGSFIKDFVDRPAHVERRLNRVILKEMLCFFSEAQIKDFCLNSFGNEGIISEEDI